jgi:quercetin dioxygenase-like cupin family protein
VKVYNWDRVPKEAMPAQAGDVLRRFVGGEQMTVARVSFSAGAVTEPHRHANEQFSLVLSGTMEFLVEGDPVVVRAGEVIHLPANALHGARALEPAVIMDVFAPPRADWGPPPPTVSQGT